MEKRFSEMSVYELKTEIAALAEKARKAEQLGIINEFAVLERKIAMAKSYLLNSGNIRTNTNYKIEGSNDEFFVKYLNGVFAWGYRLHSPDKEEAVPISLLVQ